MPPISLKDYLESLKDLIAIAEALCFAFLLVFVWFGIKFFGFLERLVDRCQRW